VSPNGIARVPGITVGHWTDSVGLTGCTVVLCPQGTVGSGEVRGGAPGTRETDLLRSGTLVQEVNAVLLTGGSAFGLAAADGVMRFLEEKGIGFETLAGPVPIVPAAVLFDLTVGDAKARPGAEHGYLACQASGDEIAEGNVGAGTGATVAKINGPDGAVKGGLGTAAREDGEIVVAAIAAVNAHGEVLDENGDVLAGARTVEGGPADGAEPGLGGAWPAEPRSPGQTPGASQPTLPGTNTTLVTLATNAKLSKERARLLSLAGHEGIAEAIRPAHTMWDGDTVFALATGQVDADQQAVEALAVETVKEAIRRAVLLAESVPGFPSVREGREA
jgi:L-aminopeptidase/D-esterase-like protein